MDEFLHVIVCVVLSLYSTEMAVAAAAAKEYGDSKAVGNHWCWYDLMCDVLGIVFGTMVRVMLIERWNWL